MSSSPPDPLAIRLPVPFPIGGVNAYLLRGDPLTLVDPGPLWPDALTALEDALRAERLRIEDLELVFISHHHVDHAGLAETVRRRAGCPVTAHEVVADLMADEPATRVAEDRYATATMALHGVPATTVADVAVASRAGQQWTESVAVDRVLRDGNVIRAGGRELEVRLRPGHSPGDTVLIDAHRRALVADHLLARAPVALLAHRPPAGSDDPRRRPSAMLAYRRSLAATAADRLDVAWPGHGRAIEDPAAVIAERLAAQEARAREVLDALHAGAATAWDVSLAMRRARPARDAPHPMALAFITLSEALASLDLLVDGNRIRAIDDGEVLRYEPLAAPSTSIPR